MGKSKSGFLAAAGVIAVLPLVGGCANKFSGGAEHFTIGDTKQASNARIAYISTTKSDSGKTGIAGSPEHGGTSSANITADGTTASMTPDNDVIDPQTNLPIASVAPELYGSVDSSIFVERLTGLNEAGDTFLTYHEGHDGDHTVYARGYVGTRTDAGVMTNLLKSATPRSATYTGTGSAYVGQGDTAYEINGDLLLTADFSDQFGLSGSITDASVTSPEAGNPDAVNQVTFEGTFGESTPDYNITNIDLNATSRKIPDNPSGRMATISDGGGTGSFFGSKAQGTMGVFSGTGGTTKYAGGEQGTTVNVIGSFAGKATTAP